MEELKEEQIPEHTGITCDSRKVKPGYAFIAITGFKEDGNKYIWEAIEKGASVIFTEKEINLKSSIPIIKVDNTRTLLGELSAEYYNHPSHNLQLIGITGTNGKTTTTHLIYNLLNANTQKSGLIGTVKVDNGSQIIPGKLTTPDPVNLQKNLKTMVNNKLKYACMEVSSHGI
ncbi:MAG: Mur ligase family protein, partial [Halanaerobiales bacterium]